MNSFYYRIQFIFLNIRKNPKPFIQTILFYLNWWGCFWAAKNGYGLHACIASLVVFLIYSFWEKVPIQHHLIYLLIFAIGVCFDLLMIKTGIIHIPGEFILLPWWLLGLWIGFAYSLPTFAFLINRHILAFIFGAIGGPWVYLIGQTSGLLSYSEPLFVIVAIHGVLWGIFQWAVIHFNKGVILYQNS
ncbi:MAG: DUF2878 domain-containing protein [Oligoflexia bacterium]|nr:DUF2878 domain-containing protein [Oligoflexia bacterium]